MTRKQTAAIGVIWSAVERFAVQGVQFVVSIILARILTPQDFGIIAIVLIFLQIFQTLNETGFSTALIYKQNRDSLDYSTAFTANIVVGIISYVVLYSISPYVANFYSNFRLVNIMRLLSLNIVINSFGLVPLAKFTINIDFKSLAKASLMAAIISGILGIIFALHFRNAYALVIQSLSYSMINVVAMLVVVGWKPSLRFSISRFREMFQYAYKLICARIISVVFDDLYSLAIGKLFTTATLGCFNRAMSFRHVLSRNIVNIVQRVSMPLLCEQQENLKDMQKVLLKFIGSTALLVYPLLSGLMVLSDPLVQVLLGSKWSLVTEILLLLCPCGFFYLISTFNRNVYNATGRTGLALKSEILKKVIFIFIFISTMRQSLRTFLYGLILISIMEMVIDVYFAKKQIGISFRDEFNCVEGILIACLVMVLSVLPILYLPISQILQLVIGTLLGIVVYGMICYFFDISNFKILIKAYAKKSNKFL